jgi:CheY-like chemotaxis protein
MSIPNVLVVDDDIAVCQILHRMLSDEQYKVQTSHSVADALGAIEQKPFDVYVMDYNLPDGYRTRCRGPDSVKRKSSSNHSSLGL